MPFFVEGVGATIWSTRLRKTITVSAALIAAVLGAWTQIKANADDLEHFVPCSWPCVRSYADAVAKAEAKKIAEDLVVKFKKYELAQTQVERTQYYIRRELADGKREAADNDLFKAQRDQKAATHALETEADTKTKAFLEGQVDDLAKQINKLQATKDKIDKSIEALDKTKPGD